MNDADRYIWLLANLGHVEREAANWNPAKHKPLLKYLQDYIDRELQKENPDWIIKQRKILNEPAEDRKHIGYIERGEGFYKLYAPPSGSIVTQAFILCKYCRGAIHPCGGPKLNAVCFHCYDVDPELR